MNVSDGVEEGKPEPWVGEGLPRSRSVQGGVFKLDCLELKIIEWILG